MSGLTRVGAKMHKNIAKVRNAINFLQNAPDSASTLQSLYNYNSGGGGSISFWEGIYHPGLQIWSPF